MLGIGLSWGFIIDFVGLLLGLRGVGCIKEEFFESLGSLETFTIFFIDDIY